MAVAHFPKYLLERVLDPQGPSIISWQALVSSLLFPSLHANIDNLATCAVDGPVGRYVCRLHLFGTVHSDQRAQLVTSELHTSPHEHTFLVARPQFPRLTEAVDDMKHIRRIRFILPFSCQSVLPLERNRLGPGSCSKSSFNLPEILHDSSRVRNLRKLEWLRRHGV